MITEGSSPYFGDYFLIGKIAEGGMGEVWVARQESLNRRVAIKVIKGEKLPKPSDVQRFHREAEAAARLSHKNIVQIYEIGEHNGHQYYSMQLIEGGTLAEQLAEGHWRITAANKKPKQKDIARLIATTARAVHYANQRGVLHRDLKPGNILLDEHQQPHIADFGVAKLIDASSTHPQTVGIFGTPSYMAPEQALGTAEITTATDVYGLGAILYELLTGDRPFRADKDLEIVKMVLEKEIRKPSSINPLIDRDLEVICLKCLEKDPDDRFSGANELAAELERWEEGKPISTRPSSPWDQAIKWAKREPTMAKLTLGLSALVIAILIGVPLAGFRIRDAGDAAQKSAHQAKQSKLDADAASKTSREAASIAAFRRAEKEIEGGDAAQALVHLAKAIRINDENEVAAVRLVSLLSERTWPLPKLLQHANEVIDADFNPDGSLAVTASKDKTAKIWSTLTGQLAVSPLVHEESVTFARFDRVDGKILVTISGQRIQTWDTQTGKPIGSGMLHDATIRTISLSPSKLMLAAGGDDRNVRVWDLRDGSLVRTIEHSHKISCVEFGPDGRLLFVADSSAQAHIWNLESGAVIDQGMKTPRGRILSADFSSDGTRLVTGSQEDNSRAHLWDARTGEMLEEPFSGGRVERVQFSPDDSLIATTRFFDSKATIWSPSGTTKLHDLIHKGAVVSVEFSADGSRVVTASHDQTACVWSVTTGETICEPLRHNGKIHLARFSPDGNSVLTCSADGTAKIWVITDGRWNQPVIQHQGAVHKARFNSLGTEILTSSQDTTAQISDANTGLPSTKFIGHSKTVREARLSSDDRYLLTGATDKTIRLWDARTGSNIWTVQTRAENIRPIFNRQGTKVLACGYPESSIYLLDAATGNQLMPPLRGDNVIWLAEFSPNGDQIIAAQWANAAAYYDVNSGKRRPERFNHNGAEKKVGYVRFSPDGQLIATASDDYVAYVRFAATGGPAAGPFVHDGDITGIEFSSDGKLLLTYSSDGSARVWPLDANNPSPKRFKHGDHLYRAKLCQGDRWLVTVGEDMTAKVWDIATGESLAAPFPHGGPVRYVEVNTDGTRFVTACDDGLARVFDLPPRISKAPPWLAELANLASQSVGETNKTTFDFISQTLNTPDLAHDPVANWARWFLADRFNRGITHTAKLTVGDWLRQRTASVRSDRSLHAVFSRYPQHPLALAATAKLQTSPTKSERFSKLALKFAPEDPDVRRVLSSK